MTEKDCSLLPIVSDVVENWSVTKQYVSHILNAYSFECPSHTQSLCAIIVRHTWPGAISWIWSTSLQIEGGPHFTELIMINMICLIYGTGICSVYHMIQTILEYTYIRPVHALLETHIHMYRTDHTSAYLGCTLCPWTVEGRPHFTVLIPLMGQHDLSDIWDTGRINQWINTRFIQDSRYIIQTL